DPEAQREQRLAGIFGAGAEDEAPREAARQEAATDLEAGAGRLEIDVEHHHVEPGALGEQREALGLAVAHLDLVAARAERAGVGAGDDGAVVDDQDVTNGMGIGGLIDGHVALSSGRTSPPCGPPAAQRSDPCGSAVSPTGGRTRPRPQGRRGSRGAPSLPRRPPTRTIAATLPTTPPFQEQTPHAYQRLSISTPFRSVWRGVVGRASVPIATLMGPGPEGFATLMGPSRPPGSWGHPAREGG